MNSMYRLTLLSSRLKILPTPYYTRVQHFKKSLQPVLRTLKNRKNRLGPEKPVHRNTFIEWNYDAEVYSFGKRLREEFDPELLRRALTERSFAVNLAEEQKRVGIENVSNSTYDNTEMAEKGEALINNFSTLYLRHTLPYYPEEGIQALKNYLSSEDVLSDISFLIGTSELILCSEFPATKSNLCSVFKALVTALLEGSGAERASIFIRDFVLTQLAEKNINDLWTIEDPIATLKTICHNEGLSQPEPRIVGEAGTKTILSLYRVGLYVDKQLIGLGPGESVEIAHEIAATDALRRLFRTAEHQLSIPFDLNLDPTAESIPNISVNDWCEKKVVERLKRITPPAKQISHG